MPLPTLDLTRTRELRLFGTLGKFALPSLLVNLARAQKTGRLALSEGRDTRVIGYSAGVPAFTMSNVRAEHLGKRLIASGLITVAQADAVENLMQTEGGRFGEAMLRLGLLGKAELNVALDRQREWLVTRCLQTQAAQVSFEAVDAGSLVEQGSVRLFACIEAAVAEYTPEEVAELRQLCRGHLFVTSKDEIALASRLGCSPRAAALLERAHGEPRTLPDLVGLSAGDETAALTTVLCGALITESHVALTPAAPGPMPLETSSLWSDPSATAKPSAPTATVLAAITPAAVAAPNATVPTPAAVRESWLAPQGAPTNRTVHVTATLNVMVLVALTIGMAIGSGGVLAVQALRKNNAAANDNEQRAPAVAASVATPSPRRAAAAKPAAPEVAPAAAGLEQNGPDDGSDAQETAGDGGELWEPPLLTMPLHDKRGAETAADTEPAVPPVAKTKAGDDKAAKEETAETSSKSSQLAAKREEIMFKQALVRKLMRANKLDQARAMSHEILALDPQNASAYRNLGIIYSHLGSKALACESYRRYLRFAAGAKDRAQVETILQACE